MVFYIHCNFMIYYPNCLIFISGLYQNWTVCVWLEKLGIRFVRWQRGPRCSASPLMPWLMWVSFSLFTSALLNQWEWAWICTSYHLHFTSAKLSSQNCSLIRSLVSMILVETVWRFSPSGVPRLPRTGSSSQQAMAEGTSSRTGPAGEAGGDFRATCQAAQPPGASVQRGCTG